MPALAGILNKRTQPEAAAMDRMLGAVPHRPGTRLVHMEGRCALGIVCGDRPGDSGSLASEDGWACAFVGTLDNALDLASSYALDKHHKDPARILLNLFREVGEIVVGRLRGEFAFAITDGRSLWSARDHLGLETLFYREEARHVFVATEAKQVVAGAGRSREPDLEVVDAILFSENDDRTPAAISGVERLRKATMIVARERGIRHLTYWDPEPLLETLDPRPDQLQERFDEVMSQAVRRALTGHDVMMLSGGIDSPGIAGFAVPLHEEMFGRPIRALSHIFPDFPEGNEQEYIETAVSYWGIPADLFQPQPKGLEDLHRYVDLFDGPWSAYMPQLVEEDYARVRAAQCHTILSGEWAEMVFEMREFLLAHLIQRGRFRAASEQLKAQRETGVGWGPIARRVLTSFTPRWAAGLYYRYGHDTWVPDWIDDRRVRRHNRTLTYPTRQMWRKKQLAALTGPGLSAEASKICQAASGVRERMPWVDVDLFEFFISLRAEVKFPDNHPKSLVRELLRGRVPDEILDRRRKVGMHDFFKATFDYPTLRKLLLNPSHRFQGIYYDRLATRLDSENLEEGDYFWAKDLACAHAFLELW